MRIWDIDPAALCRRHLLGEHAELHAVWSVIADGKKGYSRHPEVLRWKRRLAALRKRHDSLVSEMERRGFAHASSLRPAGDEGASCQPVLLASIREQRRRLRSKGCGCLAGSPHGLRTHTE